MKRLIPAILFLLCAASHLSVVKAQLLYQVSGNSTQAKSYILATNKLVDMTFLDTIPNVFKCFGQCDKVLTEFAMQDYEAIAVLRKAALLPDSVQLKNFYEGASDNPGQSKYDFIDQSLRLTLGMGFDHLARMKPSYLTEMYRNELFKKWLLYDETRSMESFFQAVAEERNMPVIGLDNIGETMFMVFDREPFHWQCDELYNLIQNPERDVKQEATIRDMYLMGRLTDIAYQVEGPDNNSTISYSDYQIYCKRNVEWVKRLQPYLHEGHAFIVLDCIYLGGDKGLLAQLRKAGYKVKPVNRK